MPIEFNASAEAAKPHLTERDFADAFEPAVRARAQRLRGSVHELQVKQLDGDWQLKAQVHGSRRNPYAVQIGLSFTPGSGWEILSTCSCPIQNQCKHAAATIAYWQLEPKQRAALHAGPERDELARWMEELRAAAPLEKAPENAPISTELQLYLQLMLEPGELYTIALVRPLLAVLEDKRLHIQAELSPFRMLPEHARLLSGTDAAALKELAEFEPAMVQGRHWYPLRGARGFAVLHDAVRARRLVQVGHMGEPISFAADRYLRLYWRADERGRQRLGLAVEGVSAPILLDTEPLSVISAGQFAQAKTTLSLPQLRSLLSQAILQPERQNEQWRALQQQFSHPIPEPLAFKPVEMHVAATPVLRLSLSADREALLQRRLKRRIGFARQYVDLGFEVVTIEAYIRGVERVQEHSLLRYVPDFEKIQLWHKQCRQAGLDKSVERASGAVQESMDWLINADYDEQTLSEFCFLGVPTLKKLGWRIEYSPGFPLKLIEQAVEFSAEITEHESGDYFDLALGIEINGQKVPLLPILEAGVAAGRYKNLPSNPDAIVPLYLPEGPVPITVGRLKLMLAVLAELGTTLARVPRMRAGLITELDYELGNELRWHGDANLRPLAERLEGMSDLPEVQQPQALQATLRPYQLFGVRWLRFLSETELAGILADDMGLGKTVQVLAHILLEHEQKSAAGEPIKPVLVIAPTSVLPNWRAEIARFTPSLSVLSLTGTKRFSRMSEIPSCNIVLTSYALLGRDLSKLLAFDFHLLVLDEAQLVKNPSTLAARAARQIRARHRLCMTGTPLENHLGELWAQFDFLMPGFLGNKVGFQRNFRGPIEKRRDSDVAARLRGRIAPFLLRRTKDQVVSELPPKSVIVKRIELEGKQRDLYETLRISLRDAVQSQLAERGAERSRISLLDALLKLRQVCCDPRLLSLSSAQTAPSAKLEQLMDMLSALITEGRRILLFSQFTTMLALIEAECVRRKMKFLLLTGQTEDRETPVRRFQSGEVPLFLISLRAGGVGLNLTAADVVIHYDPWWNPAVEEQATDRAYRIGQDKPVFVYRLIAAGTVEERIEELKQKKRELADALFDEQAIASFSADDLLSLLEAS